jgi:hypothetical protein
MIPITYELAKERMADRLREAEHHRLVQQAKAAAREEREATRTRLGARSRFTWWFRRQDKAAHAPNTSVSRSTL